MSIKALSKIFVVVAIAVFAGWRAIGHPAYLDLYANDARAKPELRAKCVICHEPTAKAVVALLSDFFPATTGEIVHVDGGYHAMGA